MSPTHFTPPPRVVPPSVYVHLIDNENLFLKSESKIGDDNNAVNLDRIPMGYLVHLVSSIIGDRDSFSGKVSGEFWNRQLV